MQLIQRLAQRVHHFAGNRVRFGHHIRRHHFHHFGAQFLVDQPSKAAALLHGPISDFSEAGRHEKD